MRKRSKDLSPSRIDLHGSLNLSVRYISNAILDTIQLLSILKTDMAPDELYHRGETSRIREPFDMMCDGTMRFSKLTRKIR